MLELVFNVIMLVFFVYCFWFIDISTPASVPGTMGADVWPQALLGTLIVLLTFNIIKVYRAKTKSDENKEPFALNIRQMLQNKFFLGSIILLAYALLLKYLGFVTSTTLFMISYMTLLSEKRWWFKIVAGIVTALVLFFLFAKVLMVPLPRGVGILRDFALWLEMI